MKLKNKILCVGQYLYHKAIRFIPWPTATWDKFDTTSPLWSVGYVCSNCNFVSADKLKRCPECKARIKNYE